MISAVRILWLPYHRTHKSDTGTKFYSEPVRDDFLLLRSINYNMWTDMKNMFSELLAIRVWPCS